MTQVKICGLSDLETLHCAVTHGADYIGFVFYPPSPRCVSIEHAASLAAQVPAHVKIVGLFVNPSDADMTAVLSHLRIDIIQLHGDESPRRVTEIKQAFARPVIKALALAVPQDLEPVHAYEDIVDYLLFDTRAPGGATGGTGQAFDWHILAQQKFQKPWMLAGGLHKDNIGTALALLSPDIVDVSSGVEREKGRKDTTKIIEFLDSVKNI